MTRTVADASRDYRQRKADKIKRYEAALREIADMATQPLAALAARQALATTPVLSGSE